MPHIIKLKNWFLGNGKDLDVQTFFVTRKAVIYGIEETVYFSFPFLTD